MDTGMQEKGNLTAGNWATMDKDILCSIFTRLPFVDVLRVESTCWGWNAAVDLFKCCSATSSFPETPWLIVTAPEPEEDHETSEAGVESTCWGWNTVVDLFKSCSATSSFPETPYLIVTAPEPEEDHETSEGEKAGRFVNIEENKTYPFNDLAVKKMNAGYCYCVASSHDWLLFQDRQGTPFLLNPFTSHRIELPARVISVDRAVLSSSPSVDNNYYLVISSGGYRGLAFCKHGDTSWTKLEPFSGEYYDDIIFYRNQLYGLHYKGSSLDYECYGIRVWDMNQDGVLFVKDIDLVLEELIRRPTIIGFWSSLKQTYLVESQGNLLFVTRFDLYSDVVYTSSRFNVFKLDADQKIWRRLTSLSGFSLFLGRNQSISVDVRNCKMLKQDAIYFHSSFGPFPSVFSLKDDSFSWLYDRKGENRRSTSIWVVPFMKQLK